MPKISYMMHVSALYVYPVKGLGGMSLDHAELGIKGFKWDRRFMLVDEQGRFISQREVAKLTQLVAEITETDLVLRLRQMPDTFQLPLHSIDAGSRPMVEIWSSRVRAINPSPTLDAWMSDYLHQKVRLVYMPETTRRSVPPAYAGPGHTVGFADAYPYLIVNETSLQELNSRLAQPVPMDRFRPNMVISGSTSAWEEDHWRDLQIGDAAMRCVKTCARCIVITTDQLTGARAKEPLATLASYRKVGNRTLFGMNTILADKAQVGKVIRVGDAVAIMETAI